MEPKRLDPAVLRQFTGSERFYRHAFVHRIVFSEGAKYLADEAGAYWLLNAIAFAQQDTPAVEAEEFQVWTLAVHADHSATLTCEDGNYNRVSTKEVPVTDFPLDGITLWFANNTIYLPSEH